MGWRTAAKRAASSGRYSERQAVSYLYEYDSRCVTTHTYAVTAASYMYEHKSFLNGLRMTCVIHTHILLTYHFLATIHTCCSMMFLSSAA